MSAARIRIGILDLTQPSWTAGATVTRLIEAALLHAHDPASEELVLLSSTKGTERDQAVRIEDADLSLRGRVVRRLTRVRDRYRSSSPEWWLRDRLDLVDRANPIQVARLSGVDVVLPVTRIAAPGAGVALVGWIPDFQHHYLGQHFHADERHARDQQFAELATHAQRMLVSSEAVRADFARAYPEQIDKVRVASFPSMLAFAPPSGDPRPVLAKYHLPSKFALVANQFWAHKNHSLVIDALALADTPDLTLVMTGQPSDYRDQRNQTLSRLLQQIAMRGLSDRVRVLGEVPQPDLVDLLRCAAVVIQPSRFEGWNLTVEDAKALARPLLCAELPVLREQAADALGFFDCDRPEALAGLLRRHWDALAAGPNAALEAEALARARLAARRYGAALLETCREAVALRHRA